VDPEHSYDGETHTGRSNPFHLSFGQFTDATSMASCLGDSLIHSEFCKENPSLRYVFDESERKKSNLCTIHEDKHLSSVYNGSDLRARLYKWHKEGYNTCFRYLKDRENYDAVGVDPSIAASLDTLTEATHMSQIDPRAPSVANNDQVSASAVARAAPVAVRFSADIPLALEVAEEQCRATHGGPMAIECSRFLTYLTVRLINRSFDEPQREAYGAHTTKPNVMKPIQSFLDQYTQEYLDAGLAGLFDLNFKRLLESAEETDSLEANWNWRGQKLPIEAVVDRRGREYGGHPVSREKFGSYAPDALSVALFAARNSASFDEAVTKCINHLGEADAAGAICGQLCGAYYGYQNISPLHVKGLKTWDKDNIRLRALILHLMANTV